MLDADPEQDGPWPFVSVGTELPPSCRLVVIHSQSLLGISCLMLIQILVDLGIKFLLPS